MRIPLVFVHVFHVYVCVMLAHLGQPLLLDRRAGLDQRLGSALNLLRFLSTLAAIATVIILVVILARAFLYIGRGRQDPPPSVSPTSGACACGG